MPGYIRNWSHIHCWHKKKQRIPEITLHCNSYTRPRNQQIMLPLYGSLGVMADFTVEALKARQQTSLTFDDFCTKYKPLPLKTKITTTKKSKSKQKGTRSIQASLGKCTETKLSRSGKERFFFFFAPGRAFAVPRANLDYQVLSHNCYYRQCRFGS